MVRSRRLIPTLALLLLAGCCHRAPTPAEIRRDPLRYCPDLTNRNDLPCDPRTPIQRANCCGDGRPPCQVN